MKSVQITFASIRRRNQMVSFLVFFTLVAVMAVSAIPNPWYQIPLNWYFIPALGLVGSIFTPFFWGRHYCGQYCPTGFIADSLPAKNTAGALLKSKIFRIPFIFLFIAIFGVSFSTWNMGLPENMTATYWDATLNKMWILWLVCPFVFALPLVFILGFWKGGRTWCNYICPWATVGGLFSGPQLQINENCSNCGDCLEVCSQPEVREKVVGVGGDVDKNCLTCLKCADVCETGANQWVVK